MSRSLIASGDFDFQIKVLLLGDSGVGKTCLLLRYAYDTFSPTFITTIGIDFKTKNITDADGCRVKLQVWDTAGQERFRTITVSYVKGAQGILLVYDVADRATFENIKNWVQRIRELVEGTAVEFVLLGNKCDLAPDVRAVTYAEGEALAATYNMPFLETSAKDDENVDEAFVRIAQVTRARLEAAEKAAAAEPPEESVALVEPIKMGRSCCSIG